MCIFSKNHCCECGCEIPKDDYICEECERFEHEYNETLHNSRESYPPYPPVVDMRNCVGYLEDLYTNRIERLDITFSSEYKKLRIMKDKINEIVDWINETSNMG